MQKYLYSDKSRLDFLDNMANVKWRIDLGSTGTTARILQAGNGKPIREAIDDAMMACGIKGRPVRKKDAVQEEG